MGNRMDTWPMTSRDLERSRSWPNYVWGAIYRKRPEIHTWSQWSTYRNWLPWNPLVTWPMTSRNPKRSRSWPRCRKMLISQSQLSTNRKWHRANRMDTWQMTSRDLERSRSWPNYIERLNWLNGKGDISKTAVYSIYMGYPLIEHGQRT